MLSNFKTRPVGTSYSTTENNMLNDKSAKELDKFVAGPSINANLVNFTLV